MNKSSTSKIPGRALVCTRRLLNRSLHEVASRIFSEDVCYFSDLQPSLESHDLRKPFYFHYRKEHLSKGLSVNDLNQVVSRDRVLRILPRDQAERMVHAMKLALEELTDQIQPSYVLSKSVDCYILDLLYRICREREITTIGFCAAVIEGRCLVTSYGEFNKIYDPDDAEIDMALMSLMDDKRRITYSVTHKRFSALQHFGNWATHWAKAALFKLMSILENDPLNFRYTYQIKSKSGYRDFFGYRCMRFFDYDWETKAQSSSLPSLFIPLSFIPECSTDYWLKDLKYVDYERFILDSCRGLAPYYQVLIKDHWYMIGYRCKEFYEQLKQIPDVILIPSDINSRLVMQKVDRILVGAGIAGVEGALRGKRVVTLGTPYYDLKGYFLRIGSADAIKDLPNMLEAYRPPEMTEQNQRALVRRLLESTVSGSIILGSHLNTQDNWENLSRSFIKYLSGPYFTRPQAKASVRGMQLNSSSTMLHSRFDTQISREKRGIDYRKTKSE